ncbi:MAG: NAD(P)/FAD-dependent oxidoreductase [Prevotellaceae bacterium]|jgi:all-trans-retinol 13,14-reductase|nr:NAD(P)/FAD-dependent oxidoreductase [Prevotellaceae bacterium]
MDKHVVVIGSGLGGLTCGYILAKNGYRVSVLEKNAQLGGCLQNFVRHGVKFETGMHYIGSMEEGQTLHRFFRYLSLLPHVKLRALDRMAYDVISIAGERFSFANGEENFVETLAQRFPSERSNLQRYFQLINGVAASSPLYSLQYSSAIALLNPAHIKRSASEFIESVTANKLLQQALAGNLPLYAGVKDKTPLYIHALITNFYNASTYRIAGGSDVIAHALVRSIRAMGGCARANAQVTGIKCDDSKAVSVVLKDGEEITGDYFISNMHPLRTLELLDTHLIRKSYRQRIAGLQNTVSNFTVYIHFKKNSLPYFNSNLYHYNEPNVWEGGGYAQDKWPGSFLYMHLCSSVDQQHADAAILMTYMNFADVAKWEGTRIGQRGEDYEALKRKKAELMLNELEKQMPGTRANIERYYTSTPLTYRDYTGTEKGSMYGILRDCTEPVQSMVSQRTKISNLLQTGQNINSHGILGVIIGAIITSGELLGVNNILKQINDA